MQLLDTVLLAALHGLTEVLPVSRSGHTAVAGLWFGPVEAAGALFGVLQLGTALALGAAARARLSDAMSEGVRAIARPSLFRTSDGAKDAAALAVAGATSIAVGAALRPYFEVWSAAPFAVGLGLVVTGLAVASLSRAPSPHRKTLDLKAAFAVGVVHGAAMFPGASRVGAALALLLWFGVRPTRALDLAMLMTIPSLLGAFAASLIAGGPLASGLVSFDLVVLGLVVASVSAAIGVSFLRALVMMRRVGALALWIIPLGLATIAYARALPSAARADPPPTTKAAMIERGSDE